MQEEKEKLEKNENQDKEECGCVNGCCEIKIEDDDSSSDEGKEKEKNKKCHKKENKELLELKEQLEKKEQENKELLEKVKYSQAELVNYRRRKDEETENLLKYSNKDIIADIIPIIDNFERAISLDDNNLEDELSKFLAGFKMIYSQLTEVLRSYDVTTIERRGEIFDSTQEQALMTDTVEGKQDDEVLEVLLKGYKLKDRVIRPATVKVNKIEEIESEEK